MAAETQLARLAATERRLWQQHEAAQKAGASDEALRPIREAAQAAGQNRRQLWAETYEIARERTR